MTKKRLKLSTRSQESMWVKTELKFADSSGELPVIRNVIRVLRNLKCPFFGMRVFLLFVCLLVCVYSSEGRKDASPPVESVWPQSERWTFLTFDVCTGEEI